MKSVLLVCYRGENWEVSIKAKTGDAQAHNQSAAVALHAKHVFSRRVSVQALAPQATTVTVALVTAERLWSSHSFAAFHGWKSTDDELSQIFTPG